MAEIVKSSPKNAPKLVPILIKALRRKQYSAGIEIMNLITEIIKAAPEAAKESVPLLVELSQDLKDKREEKSIQELARGLGEICKLSETLAKEIISLPIFSFALGEIVRASPDYAKDIFPLFFPDKVLDSSKEALLIELIKASPESDKIVISPLLEVLRDVNSTPLKRGDAAMLLEEILKAAPNFAKEIIPAMKEALHNKRWDVRKAAARALRGVIKELPEYASEVIPFLFRTWKDENTGIGDTVKLLGEKGVLAKIAAHSSAHAKGIISELLQLLKEVDGDLHREVVSNLRKIIEPNPELCSEEVIQEMVVFTCEEDPDFLISVETDALPALLKALIKESEMGSPSFSMCITPLQWITLTLCLRSNISLFFSADKLCFYQNGLQEIEIPEASKVAELLSAASVKYPIASFQAATWAIKEEALLKHVKQELAYFENPI
jgi:hypothetical protein